MKFPFKIDQKATQTCNQPWKKLKISAKSGKILKSSKT